MGNPAQPPAPPGKALVASAGAAPTTPVAIPSWATLTSGAASGLASCVLLQPMDLLKTRLQQSSPTSAATDGHVRQPRNATAAGHTARPRRIGRIVGVTRDVVARDGIRGLWRGTAPTIVRNVPGVALYFYSVTELRRLISRSGMPVLALPIRSSAAAATKGAAASTSTMAKLTTAGNLVSGAVARVSIGFVLCPVTVVKARMESSHFSKTAYPTMATAFRQIYANAGVRGLFQGFAATAARDAPYAGVYLAVYEGCKTHLGRLKLPGTTVERGTGSAAVTSASGLLAATFATLVTHPFDVLKTRIQTEPDSAPSTGDRAPSSPAPPGHRPPGIPTSTRAPTSTTTRPPLTMASALRVTLAKEGPTALLDGLALRCARKAASSAIAWTIFEAGRGLWVASNSAPPGARTAAG